MKSFIPLFLLLFLGCTAEKKDQGISYNSLSAAIIDGVITKENGQQKALMVIKNDKKDIYAVFKSSATFRETVRDFLKVLDSIDLRQFAENSLILDITAKISALNVKFLTHLPPDGYDWRMLETENILKGLMIVHYFVMLTSKDGNKCVVYFSKVRDGSEIALLEKKNNNWYIKSVQREKPEVVE